AGAAGNSGAAGVTVSTALFTAINDAFASTLLHFPEPVSYQGESLLLPHYLKLLPEHEPRGRTARTLEDALPEGVFWSSHIEDGFLFWFVARDGEPVGFGMDDLRRYDRVKPVLLALAGFSQSSERRSWSLFPYKRGPGDFYEPLEHLGNWRSAEEQIMTRTMGDLLPRPLADALREATGDDPLRLTIAAPRELTCVPWPIAMIPGTDDRLIERATLRMWTSTPTQSRRAARGTGRPASPVPFLLACDNPDGTLRERTTSSVVQSASTLLTGAGTAAPGSKSAPGNKSAPGTEQAPGTKQALMAALRRIGASAQGLFFYRGHAFHDSDPAWSALPLADDESVQAGELFGLLDDGTPFLPVPSRVILSCCSSSTASALGGEGIGLVAGLIHSGADQVIATSVDVPDVSFTEAFEDLIVAGMLDRQDGDHADLLRGLQLRMLREWKVYSLRGVSDYENDIRDPHPIIWGSYHAY
ncbi:CHAT domain-containing protein, partial [Streptomyces sp. NPDC055078]